MSGLRRHQLRIVVLWTITDIILGISYGVYRLATRASRQAVA